MICGLQILILSSVGLQIRRNGTTILYSVAKIRIIHHAIVSANLLLYSFIFNHYASDNDYFLCTIWLIFDNKFGRFLTINLATRAKRQKMSDCKIRHIGLTI